MRFIAVNDADAGLALRVHLNDHLAVAAGATRLAQRTLGSNRGTAFEEFLVVLSAQLDEERKTLEQVIAALGESRNPVKTGLAAVLEWVGRSKLNGQLRGYGPQSRVIEFEGLGLAVEAMYSLWRTLAAVSSHHPALRAFDFGALAERAARQRGEVEEHRLAAARLAFARPAHS